MGVAENIRRRRLELGLSQQQLADRLGYKARSTVNKIESGENSVPAGRLAAYAKALDTTAAYLLGRESFPVPAPAGGRTAVLILAGGRSTRNQQNIPNQFINVLGKPVIMYSMEVYQHHPAVDDIYVVCLKGWEKIVLAYAREYGILKLRGILPAGDTGVKSVRSGLNALKDTDTETVILQESTRPLVTEETVSKLLLARGEEGAAVCEAMDDYVQFYDDGTDRRYIDRDRLVSLQSPEAYRLGMLRDMFDRAEREGRDLGESCCAMLLYDMGHRFNFVEGPHNNIKVVRQEDIAILTALIKTGM